MRKASVWVRVASTWRHIRASLLNSDATGICVFRINRYIMFVEKGCSWGKSEKCKCV
jgi:hypothetical protein